MMPVDQTKLSGPSSRRMFVGISLGMLATLLPGGRRLSATVRPGRGPHPHPAPRPGITSANVLSHEQLASAPHAIEVFDQIREIPGIADGIRCQCGCADTEGFYSLLSCYESDGMARFCEICQGEGRMAYRLHTAGQSLDDIRAAIDARFG
jgi:hypothetical protein